VELDFGSTGKALAADLAVAAALAALGGDPGVLVSLGGDVAIGGRAPGGGWRILAADSSATAPESDGEVIALTSGAVATSSTTVRRWTRGETTVHHIVDPRTGAPAESPWRTASVVAANCVDANIAATAAILLGETAPEWLAA
ncbi:MAG: FAD:protein FMN transferase, partial [Chloroflexi bacterium]